LSSQNPVKTARKFKQNHTKIEPEITPIVLSKSRQNCSQIQTKSHLKSHLLFSQNPVKTARKFKQDHTRNHTHCPLKIPLKPLANSNKITPEITPINLSKSRQNRSQIQTKSPEITLIVLSKSCQNRSQIQTKLTRKITRKITPIFFSKSCQNRLQIQTRSHPKSHQLSSQNPVKGARKIQTKLTPEITSINLSKSR
jgi:hypothetical protein